MASLPTPAEILNRFYEAETEYMLTPPEQRNFSTGWGRTISSSMVLHQSADLPYGGEYHGHEGFLKWTEEMSSRFSTLDVKDPQVFEKEGSDQVMVSSTLELTVRKTGQKWIAPMCQTVRVDREKGWITEIRPFYWNVKGLNEALGR